MRIRYVRTGLCIAVAICLPFLLLTYHSLNGASVPNTSFTVQGPLLHSRTGINDIHESHKTAGSSLTHGYVATLRYNGQQGAGIRAIVSQQCWIASFVDKYHLLPIHILEPMLNSSFFVAAVDRGSSSTVLSFGDLFNFDYFNQGSANLGLALMATRDEFFKNAPRRIILLMFDGSTTEKQYLNTTKVIWTAQNNSADCFRNEKISSGLSLLLDKRFCVTEVIYTPRPYTPKPIRDVMNKDKAYIFPDRSEHVLFENWNPVESTLVIMEWGGGWFVPLDAVPTRTQQSNHRSDSSRCKFSELENVREHLIPSASLVKNAATYKEKFLRAENLKTVVVMYRLENLFTRYSSSTLQLQTAGIEQCIQRAVNIIATLQKREGFSSYPFLTHDIGRYGSNSFQSNLRRRESELSPTFFEETMNKTMLQLFGKAWTLADLERSFSQISDNEGYIAALQRTIASDADCLVLVGGGNFQDITLHEYIRKHPNSAERCVHIVCARYENILKNMTEDL